MPCVPPGKLQDLVKCLTVLYRERVFDLHSFSIRKDGVLYPAFDIPSSSLDKMAGQAPHRRLVGLRDHHVFEIGFDEAEQGLERLFDAAVGCGCE